MNSWRVFRGGWLVLAASFGLAAFLLVVSPAAANNELSADLVTVQTKSPQDGFALFNDGTKHWIPSSCFADLTRQGFDAERVKWDTEVQPRPNRRRLSCTDLTNTIGTNPDPGPAQHLHQAQPLLLPRALPLLQPQTRALARSFR